MCLAVPGKILEIVGDDPLLRAAKVSFSGVIKLVSLTCTPEARVGDFVLVHVGVAISVVDAAEAATTYPPNYNSPVTRATTDITTSTGG